MITLAFEQRSSPFLAIMTLHQLVEDETERYLEARKVVLQDMYITYVATECDSVEKRTGDLSLVLRKEQFELWKWSSDSRALLEAVPTSH